MKTMTQSEFEAFCDMIADGRRCHCGHSIRAHPCDIIYGDDGFEDNVYSCIAPGCQCREYEERTE